MAGYAFSRLPAPTASETAALASRFAFRKVDLPEDPAHPPSRLVRRVHPSLERISAWVSSLGAAATLADLDGDGLPNDLVLIDPRTDRVRVMPVPGTPERYEAFDLDTAPWAGNGYDVATMAPTGSLAGDFNEDGAIDLLVYFWGRTPLLYLRRAAGAGEAHPAPGAGEAHPAPGAGEAPATPGLAAASYVPRELVDSGESWYSNCALQSDLDGDGHLDLLIGAYFQEGSRILDPAASGTVVMHEGKSKALNGGRKHLFLWREAAGGSEPAVRYEEVRDMFGDEVSRGWTLAMGAADLDGDLLPELYLANDFGPDRLLHNRSTPGRPRFAVLEGRRDFTTPKSCVVGRDSFKGMGVDFGDLNGDGLFDIYVSNIATKYGLTESHFLWMSTGAVAEMAEGIAPYVHASEALGLSRSGFAFEARLADFDNDGTPEAMQACGFIRGTTNRWPELQALGTSNDRIVHDPRLWPSFRPGADLSGRDPDPFFVRGSDGRFHDVAAALGLAEPMVGRGIATADVDGDGRLDFVTANQWGPSYLFMNQAPDPGAALDLRLVRAGGSPAVGAVARVSLPDGRTLVGQVDGGNGHSGHRSAGIHLGLGRVETTRPVPVEIAWRDTGGQVRRETVTVLPGRRTIELAASARELPAEQRAAR